MFQSCNDLPNENIIEISIPNDSIVGYVEDYSPKGNFMLALTPKEGFWRNIELTSLDYKKSSKEFLMYDGYTFPKSYMLFDSLHYGNYDLKFISFLKDTVTKKIDFKKNIKITYPNSLNTFYNKLDIKSIPDINKMSKTDTLQIHNIIYGCFGGAQYLVEFYMNNNNKINFRKKYMYGGYRNEPINEWMYSQNEVEDQLDTFINYLKDIEGKYLGPCSSTTLEYLMRYKNSNDVFFVKDNNCGDIVNLSDLIK